MQSAHQYSPKQPVPAGVTQDVYAVALGKLLVKAAAKGPGCLTAMLLAETDAARETLGEWAKLPKADAVLDALRAHLAGTGSAADCDKLGAALGRELRLRPAPFSDIGRALLAYQKACASLTIAEICYQDGHEETPFHVASCLIDFAAQRTARPERELRREQLKRLQNTLDSLAQGSQQFARDRVSLLAR